MERKHGNGKIGLEKHSPEGKRRKGPGGQQVRKILIYNWIPFDETENKGGGVTVYTRNLIKALISDGGWRVYFLSSGRAYNHWRKEVYIERTENTFGDACRSFQVVNSPVLSSAHVAFPDPEIYLQDRKLPEVLYRFLVNQGPFDVIHFQNFEGLSLRVFRLKKFFPNTKFLYTLHNYYLFCPQAMLWRRGAENCREGACGKACVECMPEDVYRRKVIFNQKIGYYLSHNPDRYAARVLPILQRMVETGYRFYTEYFREGCAMRGREFYERNFREFYVRNIRYANRYMDVFLAVSERVAEIAAEKGIAKEKLHTSYIGTEIAVRQKTESAYAYDGKVFRVCYLGYMRKMKGFYFLLDALEGLDAGLAEKIGLRFAAKVTDVQAEKRIKALRGKFAEVELYDGYSHSQLPHILENVQLGIVPVLWEDNLPQVAIEMKACGIPVLSSDLGGAKELSGSEYFVFEAGNREDFERKLRYLAECPDRLGDYWDPAVRLVTMEGHMQELMGYYL